MGVIVCYFVVMSQIGIEERAVKTEQAAKAGLERYVRLTPNNAASIDDRLVFVLDVITVDRPIIDPQLGLEIKAIRALRKVETYQPGKAAATAGINKKSGARSTTVNVKSSWVPGSLPASRLVPVRGRQGGAVGDDVFVTEQAEIAGQILAPELVASMPTHIVCNPEQISGSEGLKNVIRGPVQVGKEYIYFGVSPQAPRPGDVRIHYEVAPEGTYSVMAHKSGRNLVLHRTDEGRSLSFVRHGPVVPVEICNLVEEGSEFNIYSQRAISIVLFFLGLMMIIVPLRRLGSMSPMLREVLDIFNPLMALAVSTFAIAAVVFCGWILFRPDVAIATLVFASAFMVLSTWISRLWQNMQG